MSVRAIVLAFAVAVAVAALLAAGWLGLALAAATGDSTPAPAGRAARDTPPPGRHARRRAPAWADRATRICGRAHEQTLDVVDNVVLDSPQLTERERVVRLVTRSVEIEGRTLSALKALRPRPHAERGEIRRALRLFGRAVAADRNAAAMLRGRWNLAAVNRQLADGRVVNGQLRLLFLGLGASACSTYFDTESY